MDAAAATQASAVTYEELADLEADFDDFDTEMLLLQTRREAPLYARRAAVLRRIPHFWPLVLEQAPPEIDQYIQPTDAAVLLTALEDFEVRRFEVDGGGEGDPRSLCFRFTFAPNDYFEDRVLEKRFWYRRKPLAGADEGEKKPGRRRHAAAASPAWSGLVSEPVAIHWKPGKDLTGGLLDLAVQVWAEGGGGEEKKEEKEKEKKEKKEEKEKNEKKEEKEKEKKEKESEKKSPEKSSSAALRKKLSNTAMGGVSFFAWFGFVGHVVSAAESRAATAQERASREARRARWKAARGEEGEGKGSVEDDDDEDEPDDDDTDDDTDDDDDGYPYEIFPDGDTLAVMLAEELWVMAIKYFKQAQEQDGSSDADFESESEEEQDRQPSRPPSKKLKT